MAVVARYDSVRDKDGETRRERNEAFETESPEADVPDHGAFIWEWFWELRESAVPAFSGPSPFSNQELAVWLRLTGNIIRREEVKVVRFMSSRYCQEIDKETAAIRERESAAPSRG